MNISKNRILARIFMILFLIAALALALYYDAFYAAPARYQVRYESLTSVFIPDQMDDISILFFSDLDYGTFMDETRLRKLTDKINTLSPDVIVFGGDLFDQAYRSIREADRKAVSSALADMKAPLGKFAVYGDFDERSPEFAEEVRQILLDGDFELLLNASVTLRNTGSGSISLTGIDSGLYGSPDIDAAFTNVGRATYNLVVCHTPDMADSMPTDLTNYLISGHSHGGQAYWGFGALYTPRMAEVHFRGKEKIRDYFTLDISNGVGTTEQDVRFLANAEVVLYRLHHKAMTDN